MEVMIETWKFYSLPASLFDTNGDEVLVEEETDVGGNVLHQKTIGTDVEWQQLQWVSDVERDPVQGQSMQDIPSQINVPCEVVEEVVEEDHGDDSFSVANFTSLNVHCSQSGPGRESADHATSCNEEKRSTTNSVYHESPEPCLEHVNHEDETVESVTVERIRDANIGENGVEVVTSQTGT